MLNLHQFKNYINYFNVSHFEKNVLKKDLRTFDSVLAQNLLFPSGRSKPRYLKEQGKLVGGGSLSLSNA